MPLNGCPETESDERRDDRSGVRRPRVRGLLLRVRRVGDLHRRRCFEDCTAQRGADAHLRTRSRRAGGTQHRPAPTAVHHRVRGERRRRRADLHRGGDAVAPRRRSCRSLVRVRRGAPDRSVAARVQRRRGQVHGPDRHRPAGQADHRGSQPGRGLRRRIQSGIPPRRRRDWRFHAPGPRGHRRGKPPCGGEAAGAVSAAQPRRGPDRGHRSGVRGAHQVRRQCLPGNEGKLHQRDGGVVRGGGRGRARRRPRHRARRAHRAQVPASRTGIRRLVLSQGHPGPGPDRAGAAERPPGSSNPWSRSTRRSAAA